MKILHFHYEMQLLFDSMVTDHHFQFRCLPMETETQKVRSLEYRIEPAGTVSERIDGFGNRVCAGEALRPHDRLTLWVKGTVETGNVPAEGKNASREKDGGFAGMCLSGTGAPKTVPVECMIYTLQSGLTRPGKSLVSFYEECLENRMKLKRGNENDSDAAYDLADPSVFPVFLMRRLYRNFSYRQGCTGVGTGAEEAFAGGKGVCQDYAQILISLCRLAGYPARYAVGLLPGEGATHAWTEVWYEDRWISLDPTHDCAADQRYIKLSHGRDFADCSVDRGCFKGCAGQRQKIYVKVEEKDK